MTLEDVYAAKLLVVAGQNPGTNHPRMLSALETAKRRGAKIIAINPLREAGLVNFRNPQAPRGLVGRGTDLADLHLPIKINGDLALFQAFGALLVEWGALDTDFVDTYTRGFAEWRDHVSALDWDQVIEVTGLSREQITAAARLLRDSDRTVFCWAMGLTQHHNAVATISEIVNLALVQGNIGKPGRRAAAGPRALQRAGRPDHGHLGAAAGALPGPAAGRVRLRPAAGARVRHRRRHPGAAGRRRRAVFVGLGGNFVQAAPDTEVTAAALRRAALTVQVSTKINRSHLVCGETALILPTLGRTERDVQASGPQFVSVEDSTCSVHASRGPLAPASPDLRSEVAIVTGLAEATLGDRHGIDWRAMRDDYRVIRRHIARVVPG